MTPQNLKFFDKFGDSYNFKYDTERGMWVGKEWISPISVALFDSSNVFMLETDDDTSMTNPTFPRLTSTESVLWKWSNAANKDEFFLYDVVRDADTTPFIQRAESKTFLYSDFSDLNEDFNRPIEKAKVTVTSTTTIVTWQQVVGQTYAYELFAGNVPSGGHELVGSVASNTFDLTSYMGALPSGQHTFQLTVVYPNSSESKAYIVFTKGQVGTYVAQNVFTYDNPLNFAVPMQVNVAFNPIQEKGYKRTLQAWLNDGSDSTQILELEFYGEGEAEDERFATWLGNFGIKFNREDALLLKDYDLTEGLPDWAQINPKRKELLVSKEQIFPYVGTYKALINFIDVMGYKDILRVKEYWKNQNPGSEYFNKNALVDITDLLDDGTIDDLNLVDMNRQIKFTNQFRKTSFLALVYEFDVLTGDYDESGIPIVERTTEFTVDEIFFKLNGLGKKIKRTFLPINVQIKDIIGEFLYFEKLTFRYWYDRTDIRDLDINRAYNIDLATPDEVVTSLEILDIKSLYKQGVSGYPIISFNTSSIDPYQDSQLYNLDNLSDFVETITKFYDERNNLAFQHPGQKPDWEYGDENAATIGCPVILNLDIEDLRIQELDGVTIQEMGDEHLTIEGVKYANIYDIEWVITKDGPNAYSFSYRGPITKLHTLPHILPFVGDYVIECRLYDLFGGISRRIKHIDVLPVKPVILGLMKIEDKFRYSIDNLKNITIGDLAGSYVYDPRTTVLDNEGVTARTDMDQIFLDWKTYAIKYGLGRSQFEIQIADDAGNFEDYFVSDNEIKKFWGTAQNTPVTKISDLQDATIGDMFHTRISDMSWQADFQNGFYISLDDVAPGVTIKIGLFPAYPIPDIADLDDLLFRLNGDDFPGIKEYSWSIVNNRLHAEARLVDKKNHNVWELGLSTITSSADFVNGTTVFQSNNTLTVNIVAHAFDTVDTNLVFAKVGASGISLSDIVMVDNGDGTASFTFNLNASTVGINSFVYSVTDNRNGSFLLTHVIAYNLSL